MNINPTAFLLSFFLPLLQPVLVLPQISILGIQHLLGVLLV